MSDLKGVPPMKDTLESLTASVRGLDNLSKRIEAATGQLKIGVATVSRRMEDFLMESLAESGNAGCDVAVHIDEALIEGSQSVADGGVTSLDTLDGVRELGETLAEFEHSRVPLVLSDVARLHGGSGCKEQVLSGCGTHEITVKITVCVVNSKGGES